MDKQSLVYVAGHKGMVGSAIVRLLRREGFTTLIFRNSGELDLRNQQSVIAFFEKEKPEYVFLAAAKVGGIQANNIRRAEFLHDNLAIQTNVIHEAWRNGVKKLLFLGSSCIYPRLAPQPMSEDLLLTGPLEPTNEPYAIAKIAGIKMCETYRSQYGCNFISVMPANLYGPNDNYDPETSHVFPALIRKFHEAVREGKKSVELWGDGSPRREFMHVDDCAEACLLLMNKYDGASPLNIGTGEDLTIAELAAMISKATGFAGEIRFDPSKPSGTPRKLLDVSRLNGLGFRPRISLEEGIAMTAKEFGRRDGGG